MGPGGALDTGGPGPSQQPMESLASGLGLAPRRPGLLRGLNHDAGYLGPGGSPGSCQLLGLKDGLGPRQAGLRPRGWPRCRRGQLDQLGLDLPLQVLFGQGHAVHLWGAVDTESAWPGGGQEAMRALWGGQDTAAGSG